MSHSESQENGIVRRRNRVRLGSKLEKNLWMYAAVASATGVGMLATVSDADAKVVYTPANQAISPLIELDLNHDGVIDFNLRKWGAASIGGSLQVAYLLVCHESSGGLSHVCVSSTSQPNAANLVRVVPTGAAPLAAGAEIGPGPQWGGKDVRVTMGGVDFYSQRTSVVKWYGPWMNGGKGVASRYLGLKFKIGSEFHYGWARVTVMTTEKGFSATLTGYAYETVPGKAIVAGATSGAAEVGSVISNDPVIDANPETTSASLGMLSLGSMGLSAWRREVLQN